MKGANKNSILVVDDEPSNIMVLTHILRPDYTVYAVKNGQDAIKTAAEFLPDLILLDIIMPEMDGYSVLTALKEDEKTKDIPVIFITGLNDFNSEKKGLSLGAADYIAKPFIPDIVKLRVENQLRIVRAMRLLEKPV